MRLLTELKSSPWYLYALHNTPGHPSPWSCHLRHRAEALIAYGQGDSPEAAIESALDARPEAVQAPEAWTIGPSLAEILALARRPAIITRRLP
jgi:hypothetical protein